VGTIGTRVSPQAGVETLGEIADLQSEYASAAVVVCPIEVGTGAKMKMLEALRFGKAIVATKCAAEGLEIPDKQAWYEEETLSECANSVTSLLSDHNAREQLENAAFEYGQQHCSRARSLAQMRTILPGGFIERLAALVP
jgi:succinoglycan biosynthesis protein ExoO